MPAKEIKELRQSGKLEEALNLAKAELQKDPDNIWSKRNISWVYYEYLKQNNSPEHFDLFLSWLHEIKDLALTEEEKMLYEQLCWQIGKIIFNSLKSNPQDHNSGIRLFDAIRTFHFPKPSEGYSFLFKALHKSLKDTDHYIQFSDWWGLQNLRPEDFQKEKTSDGKEIMTIAEQAYITYAKHLLPKHNSNGVLIFNRDKAGIFLPLLSQIVEDYPQFQYPAYFNAKLLLALGDKDNMLESLLPFAKKKQNDFWVWEILADTISNDPQKVFACYCKALSLKTPEAFLVKLRQTFSEMLIEKRMYNEAKTEIQKVIATREKHEWKLPNQIVHWTEQEWYKSATSKKNNLDLYSSKIKQAEEILFQDIPEEIIAVEFVNENKSMLNFVKDKQKFGFFNYSGNLTKPQIGDLLKVRFNGDGQDGFYKILTAKKVDSNLTSEAIRDFEGTLKVISPQNFGFIEDIFIEPKTIEESKLTDGQTVNGRALLSFNKKKKVWGWKAIELK